MRHTSTLLAALAIVGGLAIAPTAEAAATGSPTTVHQTDTAHGHGGDALPTGRINHSCGPKIDVFYAKLPSVVRDVHVGAGAHVHLSRGTDERYHAFVWWARITKAPKGSQVWMDWRDTSFAWHQCGPFKVDGSQGAHDRWTWGVNEVSTRFFRACGQIPGQKAQCTEWN
ncbi:hypothetical protein [Streptomyces sp. NPDC003710]